MHARITREIEDFSDDDKKYIGEPLNESDIEYLKEIELYNFRESLQVFKWRL